MKVNTEESLSDSIIPIERTLQSIVPLSDYKASVHLYESNKGKVNLKIDGSLTLKLDTAKGLPVLFNPDKFRLNVKLCSEMLKMNAKQ